MAQLQPCDCVGAIETHSLEACCFLICVVHNCLSFVKPLSLVLANLNKVSHVTFLLVRTSVGMLFPSYFLIPFKYLEQGFHKI